MSFARPLSYFKNRFHAKQETAWTAYKAGLDLVLPWGRRSGKSDLFADILIEDIETNGHDCLFVAKTQKQARKIVWKKIASRLKNQTGWKPKEASLQYVYKGGPSIDLNGADLISDTMAGSAYRVIAIDEYALWRKPEIVKRVLAPMLGDYNGQFLFGSTKRGRNHFWKLHQQALERTDKYFVSEATIFDNPFIEDAGRAKVLSEYAGEDDPLYKQEILNQYVTFEGKAFALSPTQYTERRWDPADLTHAVHWRGMDHGYSPDPTACVWIAWNKRKGYCQVYSEYKQTKLLINQHAEVINSQEQFGFADTISDIDPQLIAEYRDVGLHLTAAAKHNKQARILRVVNALRTGKLKIAAQCTELLDEMDAYEWGQDGNDHLIDALQYVYTNLVLPLEPLVEAEPDQVYQPHMSDNYGVGPQDFGD